MKNIKDILEIIVCILYALSIIVTLWGITLSLFDFFKAELTYKSHMNVIKQNSIIKNKLASYILLSLEILVAADIIKSIINPTFQELTILVILVFIRTLLSYFLNKEINSN